MKSKDKKVYPVFTWVPDKDVGKLLQSIPYYHFHFSHGDGGKDDVIGEKGFKKHNKYDDFPI